MSTGPLDRPTTEALLELTRLMGAAATAGDWITVAARDGERRALLESAPAASSAQEGPSAELVEALREADHELIRRALDARAAMGESSRRVRTERDVCRAYAGVMESARNAGAGG